LLASAEPGRVGGITFCYLQKNKPVFEDKYRIRLILANYLELNYKTRLLPVAG
jgi:hypothetical protein